MHSKYGRGVTELGDNTNCSIKGPLPSIRLHFISSISASTPYLISSQPNHNAFLSLRSRRSSHEPPPTHRRMPHHVRPPSTSPKQPRHPPQRQWPRSLLLSGRITVNKEQCMNCQSGFFSWVRFTNTGVNGNVAKGEVAYAYGGQNFKFGFQAGGQGCDPYGCQWYDLYSANYGCFAVMSLSYPTRAASGLSITEGEGEETAGAALVPSVVFDGSPSWTASGVAIKTAAAVPKVAPRVRRAADLEFV